MNILLESLKELRDLGESVESTIPAQPLPHDELYSAIDEVKPGTYVNVGYLKEVTKTHVQAKFTGGRGSEGNPMVRLFKATEIYGRIGIDHEAIQAIKDKRAAGIERVGNIYEIESELGNKIFKVPGTGNELLLLRWQLRCCLHSESPHMRYGIFIQRVSRSSKQIWRSKRTM